jgi:tetratricopeptide (TPR) repeat protein
MRSAPAETLADAPDSTAADLGDSDRLPVPPVPPRIAEGPDYEKCLGMLSNDPVGANAFADAWEATGGGDGAMHCHGLAQIALGNPEVGAQMLEELAGVSQAPGAARAAIYGQATQAWTMAGQGDRAYGTATLALSLSPDDVELLIERAVAAGQIEHYQDAIDDLNHALDEDPNRSDALVYRGSAWRHLGKLDLAEDDIDRALALDPDNSEGYLERGILRQRIGDLAGARQDWQHAQDISPDTATADLAQQNIALLDAGPESQ